MFTEADKYKLFTRDEIAERLGDNHGSVEWFVETFCLAPLCKGRLFQGSDILRALERPLRTDQAEAPKPARNIQRSPKLEHLTRPAKSNQRGHG